MKIARIDLRVSTDEQDLTRQAAIGHTARAAGYYIAGVYREKASGARADRPELLRLIADLQQGDVVIAEKIDRISRLPLAEAERLIASIRAKGARLAVPGVVDLSEFASEADGRVGWVQRQPGKADMGHASPKILRRLNLSRRPLLTADLWSALLDMPADDESLIRHCTLSRPDLDLIAAKRAAHNRLGLALQICFLRNRGRALLPTMFCRLIARLFTKTKARQDRRHLDSRKDTGRLFEDVFRHPARFG